jgi:NitT/TauT family transport system ATP-binding protein
MTLETKTIEVDELTKTYQTKESEILALDHVTFDVYDQEFFCIVGPSGCGKTTLLKILAGLLSKTSGRVILRGQMVEGPQENIGMVFQSPVLLKWRTALRNILLPAEVQKLDMATYTQNALALLDLIGLKGFESKYPRELSGGMQQRVAIGRALIYNPALLLMDEPFGALDAITREEMSHELLGIWDKTQKTIIFITHNITEAVFLGDRVAVLTPRPGRIARILPIDLPRPRTPETKLTQRFSEVSKEIYDLISALCRERTNPNQAYVCEP